jgi:hypothetical protein
MAVMAEQRPHGRKKESGFVSRTNEEVGAAVHPCRGADQYNKDEPYL